MITLRDARLMDRIAREEFKKHVQTGERIMATQRKGFLLIFNLDKSLNGGTHEHKTRRR